MPRRDGTGPTGKGPFTGRGEGYCAVSYPEDREPYGFAGLQGTPVRRPRLLGLFRNIFGRGLGRGRGRGRGRRW
ncbi:MAG: DUF5320 domain-containing protein [Anaerolineae bacterium]|nr:DUF5320 domain-containing protein [Anaerolineae bacterium]